MASKKTNQIIFPIYLLLVFLITSAGIAAVTHIYYRYELKGAKDTAQKQLASIASLKVLGISAWKSERLVDAKAIMGNYFIASGVRSFLSGNPAKKDDLVSWLDNFSSSMGYKGAVLFDGNGNQVLSGSQGGSSTDIGRKMVLEALGTSKEVFSDFYRYGGSEYIHLDMAVPLFTDESEVPVGAILLSIDPERFIYPLLKSWPVPSGTAETLLVERKGDDVVFLNELRHKKDTALDLSFPIDSPDLPAAIAARGKEGAVEGRDYRGAEVLGYTMKVPGSPWILVAKVDKEEVYAPGRREVLRGFLTAAVFILFVFVSALLVRQRQRESTLAKECEARIKEMAIETHYSYLTKYANDLIILLDEDLHFLYTNERVTDFYGYTPEELRGMHPKQLRAPEAREGFDTKIKSLGAAGKGLYETVHQKKDGTKFPVEVNLHAVDVEGKRFYQAIIRDITERKRAETAILESEERFRRFSDASGYGFAMGKLDGQLIFGNPAISRLMEEESEEDFVKNKFYRYYTARDQERLRTEILPVVMSKGRWIGEISLLSAKGKLIPTENNIFLIYGNDGKPSLIGNIITDITERKRSEERLAFSSEIMRQTTEGLAAVDNNGIITFVNDSFAGMHGCRPDELLGKPISALHTPEQMAAVEEASRKVKETGGFSGEIWHARPDGTVFPGWVHNTLMKDAKGDMIGMIGTLQDITERKKTEEVIRESARQWRATFDAINDSVCLLDPDGRILWHNIATERMFNKTAAELDGQFCFEVVHGLPHPVENCPIVKMKGSKHRESSVVLSGDFWFEVTVDPVFNKDGDLTAAVHVIQDVTERKRTEEVLRENREFLQLQIDRMPIAYIFWSQEFRVIAWNPAAESMFGFKRKEALGRHAYDMIVPKEAQAEVDKIWARLLSGDNSANSVNENVTKEGRRIICRWSNTPVKNADGAVKGVLSMAEDVTESFKAEIELARYRERLEERIMERTGELESFSYSVSHDLRAPIRAIEGFTRILKEEYSEKIDAEGNRIIDVIVKNTRAMGRLIDDLLAFSRLGRQETFGGEIDMESLVDEAYRALSGEMKGRSVEFNKGELYGLFGDRAMIQQVVINLLSNALKFTRKREKALIEIGSEEKGNEIVYHIRDNGEGFDMKYAPKLFGVFQRLHSQEDFEGTGIGLAIVKRIISKHGGRVWASGSPGKGATFYFSLPKRSS